MVTPERQRVMGTPVVLVRAKKAGKGRKPRLRDADRAERHLYRAAKRTAQAADRGLKRYDKARRRSARRERDGVIIDIIPNMTRGMVVTAGRLAPVPLDLLRAAWPRSTRRMTRRSVRATAKMLERL